MTVRANNLVQNWFPSEDGNAAERKEFIKLMEQIVSGVDHLKDPNRAHLKGEKNREEDFLPKAHRNKSNSDERPTSGTCE